MVTDVPEPVAVDHPSRCWSWPAISPQALHRCGEGNSLLQHPDLGGKEQPYHTGVITGRNQHYQCLPVGSASGPHLGFHPHSTLDGGQPAGQQSPLVCPDDIPAFAAGRVCESHLTVPFAAGRSFGGTGEGERSVRQLGPRAEIRRGSGADLDSLSGISRDTDHELPLIA